MVVEYSERRSADTDGSDILTFRPRQTVEFIVADAFLSLVINADFLRNGAVLFPSLLKCNWIWIS